MAKTRAALGFRAHTGWAAAVAVAGPLHAPRVIERRRLELPAGDGDESRFVYHLAAELAPAAAQRLVERAQARVARSAAAAVAGLVADLGVSGIEVVASGVPRGSARVPE